MGEKRKNEDNSFPKRNCVVNNARQEQNRNNDLVETPTTRGAGVKCRQGSQAEKKRKSLGPPIWPAGRMFSTSTDNPRGGGLDPRRDEGGGAWDYK